MPFEAKHQQFKHIPRVTKNFRNLAKTLSERHQNGVRADTIPLSLDNADSYHPLFRGELKCPVGATHSRVLDGDELTDAINCIKRFYPCFEMPDHGPGMFQTRSITVHGTYYRLDTNSILLAEFRDSLPIFGSIYKIWMYEGRVFFALQLFETVDYSVNLTAYEIKEEQLPSGLFIIEAQDLLLSTVRHIYRHKGTMFVCPREDPRTLLD